MFLGGVSRSLRIQASHPCQWALVRCHVRQSRLTVPAYFQGVGAGSGPFLQGVGAGSGPFLQGVGAGSGPFFDSTGTGAAPFAIMNEPSPCAVTAVLRPMAPTKTTIGRSRTTSLRDIERPPKGRKPEEATLYMKSQQCQVASDMWSVAKGYTRRRPHFRLTFASVVGVPICTRRRIGLRTCRVNGTVVLKRLELIL